jgi:hypothetical protein
MHLASQLVHMANFKKMAARPSDDPSRAVSYYFSSAIMGSDGHFALDGGGTFPLPRQRHKRGALARPGNSFSRRTWLQPAMRFVPLLPLHFAIGETDDHAEYQMPNECFEITCFSKPGVKTSHDKKLNT